MAIDLKVSDIVKEMQVSKNTVLAWISCGRLKAYSVASPSASRPSFRISRESIDAFKNGNLVVQGPVEDPVRRSRRQLPKPAKKYF